MKVILTLFLIGVLLSSSGCITYSTVKKAKGEFNRFTGDDPKEPHPGYYALVPLTVVGDIATAPIQLTAVGVLYLTVGISGDGP